MVSRHTPGPWETLGTLVWAPKAHANVAAVSALREGNFVAYTRPEIGDPNSEEIHANARLIAAAPELLEACQRIAADGYGTALGDLEFLKAAIAKAEGR